MRGSSAGYDILMVLPKGKDKYYNRMVQQKLTVSVPGNTELVTEFRFDGIDNKDEFEDLIRHIFDETGFPNEKLGIIALKIAQDFMKDPDAAAKMSKFNL